MSPWFLFEPSFLSFAYIILAWVPIWPTFEAYASRNFSRIAQALVFGCVYVCACEIIFSIITGIDRYPLNSVADTLEALTNTIAKVDITFQSHE